MRYIKKFENFDNQELVEEGWKENVMALIIATAGIFSGAKSQTTSQTTLTKPQVETMIKKAAEMPSIKIPIDQVFKSGKYSMNSVDYEKIQSVMANLGAFIESHKNTEMTITIESSESQVTNYDGEKSGRIKLETGELAKLRANTAKSMVNLFLNKLSVKSIKITEPKILIGDVPWPSIDPKTKRQRTKDDSVYTKDQFINILVNVTGKEKIPDSFSAYAKEGESIFMNNRLIAICCYQTRSTKNIKDAGIKNTGYENVLLRMVAPDKSSDDPNFFTGVVYEIPSFYWNKIRTHAVLTPESLDIIKKAPKEEKERIEYYKKYVDFK